MKTIKDNVNNTIIIKNSKFITYLFKVNSILEINNYLEQIKKEYKDATHYCYSYILDNNIKYSDDKEPTNTAGMPIYNVLKKKELNHILAIVVRYFGGIKLGANGLVRAYTNSITSSLEKCLIISLEKGYNIDIYFNYDNINNIDYILKENKIFEKNFNDKIRYNLNVNKYTLNKLKEMNIEININKEIYF